MTTINHSVRFELKSIGPREFEGYGSIFGNTDLGGDIVVPGAFKRSLDQHKSEGTMPLMFWMHQPDQVPGVWTEMHEDTNGLYVRGELLDTTLGRDVKTLLGKKAVRGLSIGYRANDIDYGRDGARLLKQVDLHEVSIVSMAMNPLAKVEAMKARLSANGEYVPTERDIEQMFRREGYSKSVARLLTARIFGDSDTGGMPGGLRWDAGEVEPSSEEKQIAAALNALADKVGALALRR